ncbi:MAG: flagellar hook-basal body complex protein FliE [Oligoflexia bacterium]|nr:flagellar hook-basal body complex protein FliE [Oligoflexia bacterium]
MDGLSIRNANSVINTGQTTKEITKVEQPLLPQGGLGGADSTQKSFAATLKDAVGAVNQAHMEADQKMQALATGKSQNIHETMIASEKADIALRLMVQVRNKMIEAYQEIMRMQV